MRKLTGISSMATRDFLGDVTAAWNRPGRPPAVFESVGGVDAARRVQDGEAFDMVVLARDAIEALAGAGHLNEHTMTDLVRSPVAIAVCRGAPRPPTDSADALRQTVLAARSLACSSGPSGRALQRLFAQWGIAEQIADRVVQAPPGVPVGALLASGQAALGFQQLSELIHLDGVEVLGPMPPGLEIVTTFSGAIGASSTQADSARALLDFIRSPAADAARARHGLQAAPVA
jgi:molybdate transport system substrate-binding protein